MSTTDPRDRSFAELTKDLTSDISRLVRDEIALAKAELRQTGKRAAMGVGMVAAAVLFALGAFGVLTALLVLALDEVMPLLGAAALVVLVYAFLAVILVQLGRSRIEAAGTPVPTRTVESVKEDVRWAKSHATSNDE
jgi:hypothetical protein